MTRAELKRALEAGAALPDVDERELWAALAELLQESGSAPRLATLIETNSNPGGGRPMAKTRHETLIEAAHAGQDPQSRGKDDRPPAASTVDWLAYLKQHYGANKPAPHPDVVRPAKPFIFTDSTVLSESGERRPLPPHARLLRAARS